MNLISQLKQCGFIYDAIISVERDWKRKAGFFWWLYLLKELFLFQKYNLKQKIKIVLDRTDINKLFIENIYSKKYEILQKYYESNREKIKVIFSLNNDYDLERLKYFYGNLHEVFYCNCYKVNLLISDKDNIIDCGGFIGLFSIYAKELFPNTHITIFEPESYNFKILKRNLSQYSHIHLFNKAVGEKVETRKLKISKNVLGHTIDNSPDFDLNPGYYRNEKVEIVPIDSIVRNKIDVIKMDIEGYEYKALLGAKDTITKYLPLLIIAVEHSENQRSNIINLMKSIYSRYKFIDLNNMVICFYIPKKHQERINEL